MSLKVKKRNAIKYKFKSDDVIYRKYFIII